MQVLRLLWLSPHTMQVGLVLGAGHGGVQVMCVGGSGFRSGDRGVQGLGQVIGGGRV